jgi:predicted nuclease of predicted toxin-antitoxin system
VSLVFLADENVEADIVQRLASIGYSTVHVSESSPGSPDAAILEAASSSGQVLITDDKDFGELVFRKHHRSTGVILVRLPGQAPTIKARLVAQAVQRYEERLLGAFLVIGPKTVRLRRVPD